VIGWTSSVPLRLDQSPSERPTETLTPQCADLALVVVSEETAPDLTRQVPDRVSAPARRSFSLRATRNPRLWSLIRDPCRTKQIETERIESCLDDFGTGYSSLSSLQQLPIKFLKIDQSFVKRLGAEDDALAIVKTIIVLAHQLGREVIAEGVETVKHLTILRSLGCEYGQGYFFSKPLPSADISSLLTSGRRW
jgi:hypothetical protein